MSFWIEHEPRGPQECGVVGGDLQLGESYGRRWRRPMPDRRGYMFVTVQFYGMHENGRAWLEHEIEWARGATEDYDTAEEIETGHEKSLNDWNDDGTWPTDIDVEKACAEYDVHIHDAWDGS